MSWQDLQWADIQYEALTLGLPDPEPITPRPARPRLSKDEYTKRYLQSLAVSVCSALCFVIGIILVLNAGANQAVKMLAALFGLLWLLLLITYIVIKTSLEPQKRLYAKAEKKWVEWERRAYKVGLTPQQRQQLDTLLYPEKMAAQPQPAVKQEIMPKTVRTREDIMIRARKQEIE